jgi:hypothetical protein
LHSRCKRATTYVAQLFLLLPILLNRREQFPVKHVYTFCKPAYTRPLLTGALLTCAHDVYIQKTYTSFGAAAAAGIFNAWNRAKNTIYNLAQRSPHREQQQHDRREQQQKDRQEWRRFLLSDNNDYDREDIIISIDDDVSAMSSPTTSSSTLVEGTRNSNNNDHNQENPTTPMMKQQEEDEKKKKDRKVRVVSFRLSERDYQRHLSMAKLCHENGLSKGPDIVSYIRLSMECLWQYINNNNSQARGEPSAEEKKEEENRQQQPEKKQEGSVEQQQDVVDYHPMTASSSSSRAAATAATTNTAAMGEQHTRESIARTTPPPPPPPIPLFNLHEYFQPVFDEVDKLNKMLDSHIEEENNKSKEKKK